MQYKETSVLSRRTVTVLERPCSDFDSWIGSTIAEDVTDKGPRMSQMYSQTTHGGIRI